MAKTKTVYVCNDCGAETPQWAGQCTACNAWNSLVENAQIKASTKTARVHNLAPAATVQKLDTIRAENIIRIKTGLGELDRVLGGGLVLGSVVLLGGGPGIGKSTLLMQSMSAMGENAKVLYISGEESADQVALRAHRLGVSGGNISLIAETSLETIAETLHREQPQVVVVDSIQTLFTHALQSAPGSVAQVRETAAHLVRWAKGTGTGLFLIGHVTKEGALAGPRVLEHMVDAVLYFEGEASDRFRLVRAMKNRFGTVNELGVFVMEESGLQEVSNPSAMFISRQTSDSAGSVILATQEGTRPLLVELQALVDDSQLANPRRVSVGVDGNRMAMLLAVLHRHAGIAMQSQDVYVNVAGGIRINETASDLALLLAAVSSYRNRPLGNDVVVFGEVGLGGEVRPVQRGGDRLNEASKLGFKRAIIPHANRPKIKRKDIDVIPVRRLTDALELIN